MRATDYYRLIMNNQLEDIINEFNITDFVRYKYRNKYIIEYLLERNLRTTRMDSMARDSILHFL